MIELQASVLYIIIEPTPLFIVRIDLARSCAVSHMPGVKESADAEGREEKERERTKEGKARRRSGGANK